MNKTKTLSGFSKIRRLTAVLQKCNGKAQIGGKDALISEKAIKVLITVGLVLLAGVLFTLFYMIEPMVAPLIPLRSITLAIMLIMLLMSFILSVKNIVTVLYTADDLSVLLPMPLSAGQIVAAKLAVASRFTMGLSVLLINTICLGFGIRAGAGASYIIGALLSSVLIPVAGIAIATLIVVIVFRVFGFIRNRDITMVLSGIFTLAIIIAYVFISNRFNSENSSETVLTVFNTIASISAGFPNISFMADFMLNGSALGLMVSVGAVAVTAALAAFAVKLFYFSTALDMQTTGSTNKAISKSDLEGKKKSSVLKALTGYESKSSRRNPSYLIYGFAMSFIWPLIIGLPMFFSSRSILETVSFPFDMRMAAVCAVFLGIAASCMSCGFNLLAATAFSREGKTFSALCALPIDFREYYKSKRNFAMLVCSLGSVGYVMIIGIVCLITGVISVASGWVILCSAAVSFLLNTVLVNWMLVHNSKKPYFNWDSETEISRKLCWINIVSVIMGIAAFIAFMIAIAFSSPDRIAEIPGFSEILTTISVIIVATAMLISVILAFAVNRFSVKRGAKNLTKLI